VVPSAGGGPVPQVGVRLVSNSEMQTFKDCRRKWWLGWYRGMKLRGGDSPLGVRAVGDRIHRAMRLYYVPDGYQPLNLQEALERLILDDWSKLAGPDITPPSIEFTRKFDSQANLERAMVEGYLQWIAETGQDADLEIIAPETYVEAPLFHDQYANEGDTESQYHQVKLIGKLDVRTRRRSDKVRLIMDHKTVGDLTSPVMMLNLDEQMLTYHLLEFLTTEDADERCDGALYNMLRRVKRTAAARPPFYSRVQVNHNELELHSIERRIEGTVEDMLTVESMLTQGVDHHEVAYPRPSRDCTWKCDFFPVCPMFDDGSRAEAMLDAHYTRGDPLSYYATSEVPPVAEEEGI
jgi:hypothetical protein